LSYCVDTSADVNREPSELLSDQLALAGVKSDADPQPEQGHGLADCGSAPNGLRGPIEAREEPVSGGIDLAPSETLEFLADNELKALEELLPAAIADCRRPLGGADDVDEHHRRHDGFGPRGRLLDWFAHSEPI
jgi:hypothetical protein